MKKILSILALFIVTISFGQVTTTINFDTLSSWTAGSGSITSYQSDHTFAEGVFSVTNTNGLQNSNGLTDGLPGAIGTYSWRLRNIPTEAWTATIASGGVSTFSVMVRQWDGSPAVTASLDYSIDAGITWVNVDTINPTTLNNASAFVNFSGTINSSAANIKVRIQNVSGERLMIDDFVWTDNTTSTSCNIAASGLASLTCNDAGTGSIVLDDYLTFDLNPTGTLLGATYTVAVSSGTVTPTTGTYGAATTFQLQAGSAGAGNVVLTLTDAGTAGCSATENITDPGVCSSASPVIALSPSSLTGFDHTVGTPSAEQTFTAGGLSLTNDITVTAPANFEVSLTSGSGFASSVTIAQVSGMVPATTIYARGNATVMGAFSGDIVATSTGATNDTVQVSGMASDYVYSTIDLVTTIDPNGVANSLGNLVELTGVVHCIDFDGNSGYSITLIDGSTEGINLFSFNDVSNYTTPLEGDSLRVFGVIGQYNGLLQVAADSIELLSQGAALAMPMIVTTLDETTESQIIRMDNLTFVTPIATFPTGSNNIDVTDGTNTFTIRIDSDTDIPGAAAPQGTFSVIGVGGQFDSSSPFTDGYQLFPCGLASFIAPCTAPSNAVTITDSTTAMATATGTGITYQWIQCPVNNPIPGATTQSFTAAIAGDFAVIVTNGSCSDTSICINLLPGSVGLGENAMPTTITVYPNPSNTGIYSWTKANNEATTITITDLSGRVIDSKESASTEGKIDLSTKANGTYYVIFRTENTVSKSLLIKQ